jgi:hypothetical protein
MKNKLFSVVSLFAMMVGIFAFSTPAPAAAACEITPQVVTLYAGQDIDVGTVTVTNDADNLYVTFETSGDWWLQKTHLHVAETFTDIPQNNKGNPKIGNFAYQTTHDPRVQSYTYVIAKSSIGDGDIDSLVIAAHAEVVRIVDGEVVQSETGWGDGDRFVDKGSWATYFSYSWQDCEGGPEGDKTETAFAYGGDDANCFLDLDLDGDNVDDFNRWGWTNGAISGTPVAPYEGAWQLWAGAAQCDITDTDGNPAKGTLVGTVDVSYDGSSVTVTFTTNGPYYLEETHVYAGAEQMPRINGNGAYTAAPGQYKFTNMDRETFDDERTTSTTTISVTGEIYIVAHATVGGFTE